jgi:hypothetical protein
MADSVQDGALKKCPRCAEDVKQAALVCRYCGHEFSKPSPTLKPEARKSNAPMYVGLGLVALFGIALILDNSNSIKTPVSPNPSVSSDSQSIDAVRDSIVGSANATSSTKPPDSFRGIKWESTLPSIATLHRTVMRGCTAIPDDLSTKTKNPCSHWHTDTDDEETFDQQQNLPPFLSVSFYEQMMSWSHKKFWSGQLFSHNEADYSNLQQLLKAEYGPPTFENRAWKITRWRWSTQPRDIVIQLSVDNEHNVALLFTQEE